MGTLKPTLGLQKNPSNYFSCCHWNVSSILAHNKISLLTAYNTVQKFDIICISETYLDSTVDNKTIEIKGYNLIIADSQIIREEEVYVCTSKETYI